MSYKKKILWVSEASSPVLSTGFSVLSAEILNRLHATGKYEISELGSYAKTSHPKAIMLPWNFYGAIPEDGDQNSVRRYNESMYGQFGETMFEKVLLETKADIVIESRDRWMSSEWQLKSPFRKYFKYILMPTIDGEPQRPEWISDYSKVDTLLTYSEYGKKVLAREGPHLKVSGVVRPGVNHDIFRPMDKVALRKAFDVPQSARIIMTTMRNQKRKLFPDLIDMFAQLMHAYGVSRDAEALKNTYLYLHTSYPDVGYDIGRHIMQSGLSHKILVSYVCENCRGCYPDHFQGEITNCKYCGSAAAHMPNTAFGVDRQQLAQLYNLADLYVQYSVAEGFGIPIAEAKACGIPSMGVDYSAVCEQVNTFGCFPIAVERFFYESVLETEQRRALPDNKDAVRKIREFFRLSEDTKRAMSHAVRVDAATNYSFDRAAKVFEDAIDNTEILDRTKTWDNPVPQYMPCNTNVPRAFKSVDQMIDWCFLNILGQDPRSDIAFRNSLIKGITTGIMLGRRGKESFDANKAVRMMVDMANNNNQWENARLAQSAPKQGAEWINV